MSLSFLKKLLVFLIIPILGGLIFCLNSFLIPFEVKADDMATTSVTVTVAGPVCGNGTKEGAEQCDGSDFGSQTCITLSFAGGSLTCNNCIISTSACTSAPSPGGGGGGGGGVYVPPITTRVILQGKAYPQAKITILYDGKVATLISADSMSNFKIELTTLTAGTYNFSLWAEDKEGRRSITFSFTVTVTTGMTTTISNIFLPPTIELDKVNLLRGETLKILGQTAPESEISIHVESPQEMIKKTTATKEGKWNYLFDTNPLDEGSHTVRAKAESPDDLLSSFSKVLGFYIGKYGIAEVSPKADFQKDGKTNLIDFSIMLYWWGKYNPAVDMNQDGIVNLPDFSILMYYWTG